MEKMEHFVRSLHFLKTMKQCKKYVPCDLGFYILTCIGSMVLSFGLYHIHSFADVTEGGVLGLTLLLEYHFGVSPALSGFIFNFICYCFGLKSLGWSFLIRSLIASILFSVFYGIFECFNPLFPQIEMYPLEAAVLGGIFVGIGVGLCVLAGGAPSGDDALAMSVSHMFHFDIQWVYLFTDLIVLILSLTYIPLTRLGYSFLTVFLSGQIIGKIQKIPYYIKKQKVKQ